MFMVLLTLVMFGHTGVKQAYIFSLFINYFSSEADLLN